MGKLVITPRCNVYLNTNKKLGTHYTKYVYCEYKYRGVTKGKAKKLAKRYRCMKWSYSVRHKSFYVYLFVKRVKL